MDLLGDVNLPTDMNLHGNVKDGRVDMAPPVYELVWQ